MLHSSKQGRKEAGRPAFFCTRKAVRVLTINDYCKRWRITKQIRQSDIASIAGLSDCAISEFERGKTQSGKIIVAYIIAGMEISHPNSITIDS